ncbi:hypothetical protein [Pantoea ananatis]
MQLLINSLEHPKNLGLNEMLLGRLLKVNLFSQSTTYVKPAARLLKIIVTGGGGGGGALPQLEPTKELWVQVVEQAAPQSPGIQLMSSNFPY